jgi:hypothetical protein
LKRAYPSQKAFYIILISAAVTVLAASLTALMRGKDFFLFERFRASSDGAIQYGDYLALTVIAFLLSVLIPVAYALHTVFFAVRNGHSRISRIFWGFLLFAAAVAQAASFDIDNLFFYVQLSGLLALFFVHASGALAAPHERRDRP